MLSTTPAARPAAWEQAIFPVTRDLLPSNLANSASSCGACPTTGASSGLWLCRGDVVSLAAASCAESLLSLRVVEVKRSYSCGRDRSSVDGQDRSPTFPEKGSMASRKRLASERQQQRGQNMPPAASGEDCVVYIDRPDLTRLNDMSYWTAWQSAIGACLQSKEHSTLATNKQQSKHQFPSNSASLSWGELPQTTSIQPSLPSPQSLTAVAETKKVLDLTHGLPLTSLLALNEGEHMLSFVN